MKSTLDGLFSKEAQTKIVETINRLLSVRDKEQSF